MRLENKVAVVTGGAGLGMGSAVVQRLASEGAAVVVADVDEEAGIRQAEELRSRDHAVEFVRCDATSFEDQAAAVDFAVAKFGKLDVFHAHAVAPSKHDYIANVSPAEWDEGIRNVLSSVFYGIRAALPQMIEQRSGSLIATSSACAFGSQRAYPMYAVGKSAILTLVRQVASEYGSLNIRCNAIAPGITGPSATAAAAKSNRGTLESFTRLHALGRRVETDEIADAVAWLASEESSAITGAVIPVDGGFTATFGDFFGNPPYGQPADWAQGGNQPE